MKSPPGEQPSATEHVKKMTVSIQPQDSGDLVVTEPVAGSIRVHHTVHPDAESTPVPGKSFDELEELGPGTHEIDVEE